MPDGNLPSLSSFSKAMISCKLVAFLMRSCNLFLSSSVSLIRDSLEPAAEPLAAVLAAPPNDLLFLSRICASWSGQRPARGNPQRNVKALLTLLASSVGSSGEPKSSLDCCLSASFTLT